METGRTPTAVFCHWRDRGVWAGLLEAKIHDPEVECLIIDASYIKAHPHSAGARCGNQSIAAGSLTEIVTMAGNGRALAPRIHCKGRATVGSRGQHFDGRVG